MRNGMNDIYVFDLDNTLVKTDRANNLAYQEAIKSVAGVDLTLDMDKRFTRSDLMKMFSLSEMQKGVIISEKERLFERYIGETALNENLVYELDRLHREGCRTILLTHSRKSRALQLCYYYNLSGFFDCQYFNEDYLRYGFENKYSFLQSRGYDLRSIILFENEDSPKREAVGNGVKEGNIIKINF